MKQNEEAVSSSQRTRSFDSLCHHEDLFSMEYLIPGFSDSWTTQEEVVISIPEFFKIQDPKGARKP